MRGRVFRIGLAFVAVASLATGVAASSEGSEGSPPTGCERAPGPGRAHGAAEHRVRPHRRPVDEPAALHAARAGDAARRADVHELLRVGLAVLSVALVDLHRQLPARHKVFSNVGPRGGFREFYHRGEEQHTFAVALQQRRLPHGDDGQVPQRLWPADGGRPRAALHLRPAGMVGVGCRGMGLSGVQLHAQPERRSCSTTAAGTPTT